MSASRRTAILADSRVQHAFRILKEREPDIEADQIRLTLVAAPPFEEGERSRHFAQALRATGFSPSIDTLGNVIVAYGETGPDPVIVGAHLDTVFPRDVKLELRRAGRILNLPGISDNGAGLVALLWILRSAREAGLRFRRPVWGVANVGEEGQGNLRGIRHLFESRPWGGGECEFIAVDGAGIQRVTNRGLGSRRFRIRLSGPGGHSWADFGRPNPVHAMATAIHHFTSAVRRPGTSFNVGTIHGGIGVNAIPKEAIIEVDLRSTNIEYLENLQAHLKSSVSETAFSGGQIFRMESIGERPLGATPAPANLVQAAMEVTRAIGVEPQLDIGSTDANLPMSLGFPAIALGAGGSCANIHTPEEWFDPAERYRGLQRLLGLVAVLAGLERN
jgi:acetylornithine deacetylase/succinyl-diaminopimelate desuccinylase-like protein